VIEILKPGLQTTVQDLGRPGRLSLAMPPSGALDQLSHRLANALVGNTPAAATLEVAFMGPSLTARDDVLVSVTGADIDVYVDDVPQPTWTAIALPAGSVLRLGMARHGVRAYIAVAGGIDVPVVMGSRSTYLPTAIGGHDGRALKAADLLPLGTPVMKVPAGQSLPEAHRPPLGPQRELRIVRGLASYRFTPDSLDAFSTREYAVSPESNRTGYRFVGDPLQFVDRPVPFGAGANPSNVVSFGYPLGSIQVPNGEEPICLLRDAVTGGGFVTLGTVISADLDLLAQSKAPDVVRFVTVDVADALALRRERAAAIARAVDSIS
jgi:biotin-dependent carboxylase-like uncharacterized protein